MIDKYLNDLMDEKNVKLLKDCLELTFKTEHGKKTLEFIEWLCRFYHPTEGNDPNDAIADKSKREVYTTLLTLLREDVTPELIAKYYQHNGR